MLTAHVHLIVWMHNFTLGAHFADEKSMECLRSPAGPDGN